jgi:uncharacterized membrane protein
MAWPRLRSRHWNFYIAVAVGIATAAIMLAVAPDLFPEVAASAFSLAYLVLSARDLPKLTPDYLRHHAADEDAPPWVVFLLTLAIVIYVTGALFVAVNDTSPNTLRLVLGIVSVALAWLMIHVMWGMHYAWEYYEAPEEKSGSEQAGGLKFPGDEDPCGMDFVYFSLVVAMTAQTSDTNVTSSKMRRVVTGHSLFSYLFTTVFIAASVNIVMSLGNS